MKIVLLQHVKPLRLSRKIVFFLLHRSSYSCFLRERFSKLFLVFFAMLTSKHTTQYHYYVYDTRFYEHFDILQPKTTHSSFSLSI